ncbi:MAG TPA: hypothetical protein PJ982_09995 [Lacipirellulaceae bacterium]|nr:hypothetical protein [Lacipirellulaceae bacterium]
MPDPHSIAGDEEPLDEQLEAYLDGLLDEQQAAAFALRMEAEPALRRAVELQAHVDSSLVRQYRAEPPSAAMLAAMLAGAAPGVLTTASRAEHLGTPAARSWQWYGGVAAALAAAAAMAWLLAAPWQRSADRQPLFAARPLVEIYNDAVATGFEPTYECHDPAVFAETFQVRQGTPLKLLPLPDGVRMLGLAYVGGLSRSTPAMLALVDEKPVMVFVDRAAADRPLAADIGDARLRVFRQQRDSLVFYEVTPLDRPRVMEFLAVRNGAGDAP